MALFMNPSIFTYDYLIIKKDRKFLNEEIIKTEEMMNEFNYIYG